MKTLVVVSKYNEDVSWTDKITHDVLIYDKSDDPIPNSIVRPNVGREAETLLTYIIDHYDNLPDLTVFLQGDPRSNPVTYSYEEVVEEVNKEHEPILKTILTWQGTIPVNTYWLLRCRTLHKVLFDTEYEVVTYSSGAQYVIPKQLILNRPLDMYTRLREHIFKFDNKSLVAEDETLNEGIDAWTLEIIWGSIFNNKLELTDDYATRLDELL